MTESELNNMSEPIYEELPRRLPDLTRLVLLLKPSSKGGPLDIEQLRADLRLWADAIEEGRQTTSANEHHLYLEPWKRNLFTRARYLAHLAPVGKAVEDILLTQIGPVEPAESGEDKVENDPCLVTVTLQEIGDEPERENWWVSGATTIFPTFARWGRLRIHAQQSGE